MGACCPSGQPDHLLPFDGGYSDGIQRVSPDSPNLAAAALKGLTSRSLSGRSLSCRSDSQDSEHSGHSARSEQPNSAARNVDAADSTKASGKSADLDHLKAQVEKKQRLAWERALREEQQQQQQSGGDRAGTTQLREMPLGLDTFEQSLWAAFVLVDRDGNGQLSRWEFTHALKAAGAISIEAEARTHWTRVDADANGAVDWAEFCALGRRCHELAAFADELRRDPAKVARAARTIQRSHRSRRDVRAPLAVGGGAARVHERARGAQQSSKSPLWLPPTASQRSWEAAIREEAAQEERVLGSRPVAPARAEPTGLSTLEKSLWAAFVIADRDGNGQLSRWEFALALVAAGAIDDVAEARAEWERADLDASGAIEWGEFRALGRRRKALAALPGALRTAPDEVERATLVIQRGFQRRSRRRHGEEAGQRMQHTSRV
jgi:Ca2+-binding EF-hand superfamily protein